jgi:DNA-binding LacI/PurR family transcriptional regulator
MARVKCPKCTKVERILKAGIVRNKQRYYCKDCNYHFIVAVPKKSIGRSSSKEDLQTSMQDIAKAAGVSTTTVSRALNNRPDINNQTSKFIKELALAMNYQPNILAQSLVTRSTHTLGVIIPSLETTIFSTMLSGIQEVAALAGYRVNICTSNENHETEIANIQALMNNMIDGLLICHTIQTNSFEHIRSHIGKRIPIVQFYRVADNLPVSQILADDESGAEQVTEYLIQKGCRRIAILLGSKGLSISQKRFIGYQNILQKHQLKIDEKLIVHCDFTLGKVVKAVDSWLKIKPGIDAIISISDKSAVQIIRHLKEKKVAVPGKIRVFGFGNEFVGEIVDPSLSTFDTKTKRIGEEASRLIIEEIITGKQHLTKKIIPGKMIIRKSG